MADRPSWWVIPGALVVLTRVVTLVGDEPAHAPAAAPREASAKADPVVLRDASGRRSPPLSWSALTASSVVLTVPGMKPGDRGALTMWPLPAGRRAAAPAVTAVVPVRDDGTIALGGIAPGRYEVQVVFGSQAFTGTAVTAPGEHRLTPASPVR